MHVNSSPLIVIFGRRLVCPLSDTDMESFLCPLPLPFAAVVGFWFARSG